MPAGASIPADAGAEECAASNPAAISASANRDHLKKLISAPNLPARVLIDGPIQYRDTTPQEFTCCDGTSRGLRPGRRALSEAAPP